MNNSIRHQLITKTSISIFSISLKTLSQLNSYDEKIEDAAKKLEAGLINISEATHLIFNS